MEKNPTTDEKKKSFKKLLLLFNENLVNKLWDYFDFKNKWESGNEELKRQNKK